MFFYTDNQDWFSMVLRYVNRAGRMYTKQLRCLRRLPTQAIVRWTYEMLHTLKNDLVPARLDARRHDRSQVTWAYCKPGVDFQHNARRPSRRAPSFQRRLQWPYMCQRICVDQTSKTARTCYLPSPYRRSNYVYSMIKNGYHSVPMRVTRNNSCLSYYIQRHFGILFSTLLTHVQKCV